VKYYTATPDWKKIDEKTVEENKLADGSISLKTVTFKKCITFESTTSVFTVKYMGNDTQYPWKQTLDQNVLELVHLKESHEKVVDELENIQTDNLEVCLGPGRSKTILRAKPCLNSFPERKFHNLKSVNHLLCLKERSILKDKLCDATKQLIVHPRAGDCFLWDTTCLKDWSGNFHNDGCSWKQFGSKHWSDNEFSSKYYHIRKQSKVIKSFSKEMHVHDANKRIFVHYYGNDDIVKEEMSHGNRTHGTFAYIPTNTLVKVNIT